MSDNSSQTEKNGVIEKYGIRFKKKLLIRWLYFKSYLLFYHNLIKHIYLLYCILRLFVFY